MSQLFGGSLNFDHRVQEWAIFKSRFIQYCAANDIAEDVDASGKRRRALLLTALVEDTYRVVRDLAFPKAVEDIGFENLLEILDGHFTEKRSSFGERFQFYMLQQREGEEIAEWAARVRSAAQHCGFKSELETVLRDRFVLGLQPSKEKERLFTEKVETLTFTKAIETAQSVRCARLALSSACDRETVRPVFAMRVNASRGAGAVGPQRVQSTANWDDNASRSSKRCDVCGYKNHTKEQCRFAEYSCRKCNQKGHLVRMCRSAVQNSYLLSADNGAGSLQGKRNLFNIECRDGKPMSQLIEVAGVNISCEVDSGSAVSVMPYVAYSNWFEHNHNLSLSNVILNCYNGSKISPMGCVSLPVTYDNSTKPIKFLVIETKAMQPVLLGRDFIESFQLKFCRVGCNHIEGTSDAEVFKTKYAELFKDELGKFNKFKISLRVKPGAELRFFKARPVPLALKAKVEIELKRLLRLGILEKVEHSEFATPIVPVLRSDGNIRICGDYSVTLNKVLMTDSYPLPRIEDLFSKLHGGVTFSKLDLSRAYNQLELDDTKRYTCINTHIGLFQYSRLVFGLSHSPFIFQRTMEQLLGDIEGVCIFVDDILVTGPNNRVHSSRLEEVFRRLQDAGLKLRNDKCELFKDSVEYLGYKIDKSGLHKSEKKVEAILSCSPPKNVSELKSLLGMMNYYRCFIPNMSSILSPLYLLLKKGVKWNWSEEHTRAFDMIKHELASSRVLAHYDPRLTTVVTADAGPHGLGAVLAQRQPDGQESAVAFASRSLSVAERNYSQIQKEAAAIVFAMKKFHHYLYGRTTPFTLRTDHKPLLSIFGSKKGIPEMAANRLQRYAIFLSAYNFNLEYIKSQDNVADFLSRALEASKSVVVESEVEKEDRAMYINFIYDSILKPVTIDDIARETSADPILSRVSSFISRGWPPKIDEQHLKPYFACRLDLSVENGCVLRGHKVVIPGIFRERLLTELHKSHFGIVRTKTEARLRMWWPGMDQSIEEKIGACSRCNVLRSAPPRAPLASWPCPDRVWDRLHLDMLTIEGWDFLVITDAFSKWLECFLMDRTDSEMIKDKLGSVFSRFGLVRFIVTDNGTNFCSREIESFYAMNGIKHLTTSPYHPQSNGQAENSVKTVKRGLKNILMENKTKIGILRGLDMFLFDYRNSKHSTTGFSPAELLLGRPLRCRLDLLKFKNCIENESSMSPLLSTAKDNVSKKQLVQAKQFRGHRNVELNLEDKVLCKIYKNGKKFTWMVGRIKRIIGSRMYEIFVPELNKHVRKHLDQIIKLKHHAHEEDRGSIFGAELIGDGRVEDHDDTIEDSAIEVDRQFRNSADEPTRDSTESDIVGAPLDIPDDAAPACSSASDITEVPPVIPESTTPTPSEPAFAPETVTKRPVRSTRSKVDYKKMF